MPEIILPIPLNNNAIDRKITIITRASPGEANRIAEKPITIAPIIMLAMRDALLSDLEEIPAAIRPAP